MDLVELLRPVYAEWARGNFRAGGELLHDDVEFVPLERLPDSAPVHGRGALDAYMLRLFETFRDYRAEALRFEPAGERVLVHVHQWGTSRSSGLAVELDYFHVWTFHDGRVKRIENVGEEADARRAAGLA